jgi:drug/metabolite transporter (DMT)-like permease
MGDLLTPAGGQRQPSSRKPLAWLIAACLLAVYIIWGTTYFAIKVGVEAAAPFFLVGTRSLVAGGLLLGWQAIRGRPMPLARQWRGAALTGCSRAAPSGQGVAYFSCRNSRFLCSDAVLMRA